MIMQAFWLISIKVTDCDLMIEIEVSNDWSSLKKFRRILKSFWPAYGFNVFA